MANRDLVEFYRSALDEQRGLETLAATSRLSQASDSDPDQMYAGRAAAKELGKGIPLSAEASKEMQRRRNLHEWAARMKDSPHLRAHLSKPENALIAHDDVDALAKLEEMFGPKKFRVDRAKRWEEKKAFAGLDAARKAGVRVPTGEDEFVASGPSKTSPKVDTKGLVQRAIFGDDGLLEMATGNKYAQSAAAGASRAAGGSVAGVGDTIKILAGVNDWFSRNVSELTGMEMSDPNLSKNFVEPFASALQDEGEAIKSRTSAVDVPVGQRNFGTDVAGAIGQIGIQALAAVGNAPVAAVSMFTQGVNAQRDQLIQEGVDPDSPAAQAGMMVNGFASMITEMVGVKSITKLLPAVARKRMTGVLAQAIQSGSVEAVTEATQSVIQNLITYTIADVDEDFTSFVSDGALYDGAVGGTAGGGVNLFLNLLAPGRARVRVEGEAEAIKEQLDNLHAASEESKLKARAPEQFAEFVKEAQGKDSDNSVYMPAGVFAEMYQTSDAHTDDIARHMGIDPAEFEQAQAAGHDVAIPLEKYLANTDAETHAKIVDHLKVEPDGFSIRDIESGAAEEGVNALGKYLDRVTDQNDPTEWVSDQARDTMVDGGMPRAEAELLAVQFGAMVTTMAERSGMKPSDYLQAIGGMPEFRVGGQAKKADSPRVFEQPAPTTTKSPTPEQIASKGFLEPISVAKSRYHGMNRGLTKKAEDDLSEQIRSYKKANAKPGQNPDKVPFEIINDDTGWALSLGTRAVGKFVTSAGTDAIKLEGIQHATKLMKNAVRVKSRTGEKQGDTAKAVHYFVSAIEIAGQMHAVQILARRTEEKKSSGTHVRRMRVEKIDLDASPLRAQLTEATGIPYPTSRSKIHIVDILSQIKVDGTNARFLPDEFFDDFAARAQSGDIEFDQRGANASRGSLQFPKAGLSEGRSIINLFEGRDLSTSLHELSHYYLEVLRASAQMPNATPELRQMWADAKEYLGIEGDGEISREAHEKWAETGEVYFGTGKAPSAELQTAFERFRGWMLQVWSYVRRVYGTEVDQRIDPKVRDVFDRMLATDQQIAEVRATAETMKAFTDPETAGMGVDEWAAYNAQDQAAVAEAEARAQQRVADEYRAWQKKEHKRAMAKAREQAEQTVSDRPIYRLIDALTRKPDDPSLDWQLDRDAVIKMGFGDHMRSKKNVDAGNRLFPTSQRGIYTRKGVEGAHPDIVAATFGFESGRGMMNEILNAQPRKEAVEAEAQRIYKEQHGDALTDGSIADAVYDGMHADEKAKLMEMELKALYRKAPVRSSEPQSPSRQEIREIARQQIAKLPIKAALKSRLYLAAERRHAREAYRHAANGDFAKARAAKLQQMLNFFLYKESVALDKAHEANLKKVKRVNRDESVSAQKQDIDFVKAAKLILFRHGLAKEPEGYSFHDWFMDLQAEDPTTSSMLGRAVAIANGDSKPWNEMTVTEYRAMFDAVTSLLHIGRDRREVEINGEKRDIEDTRNMFVAQAREHYGEESRAISANGVSRWVMSKTASLRRVSSWARMVDGGDDGPIQSLMVRPIYDAIETYRAKKKNVIRQVLDAIEPSLKDMYQAGAVEAPELDFTFKNKGELFVAILNTGTESNMETLLEGRGWNDNQWSGFVNRMIGEGVLTKADFDAAQQVWDIFESLRRPANTAHRKMYGHYFDKIPRRSFTIGGTKYRGGYVPLVYDKDASSVGQMIDVNQIISEQHSGAMFPSTGRGFTKSRTGVTAPVALDLRMIPGHVDKVLRFTYLQAPIRTIGRVMAGHDFKEQMHHVDPHLLENLITPWLQRTASQQIETRSPDNSLWGIDPLMRTGRRVAGATIMIGNVVNALQQFTGFFPAMTRVKPGSLMRGMASYYFAPKQTREFVFQRSQFMEHRVSADAHETMQDLHDLLAKPNRLFTVQSFVMKYGYFLQQISDRLVAMPVWLAAYNEAAEAGMSDRDAARRADSAVRDTQSSFSPEDVSAIEAGGSTKRAFVMFANYFNAMFNLGMTERHMMHPATVAALVVVLPATMAEVIGAALRGGFEDEDEDGYFDDIAMFIVNSNVRYLLAMVPGLGNAGNALWGALDDKAYNDRVSLTPVSGIPEKLVRAYQGIERSAEDGEVDARAVKDSLTAIMVIFGIGGGNAVGKAGGYTYGVATGEYDPDHVGDVVQGILSGRESN